MTKHVDCHSTLYNGVTLLGRFEGNYNLHLEPNSDYTDILVMSGETLTDSIRAEIRTNISGLLAELRLLFARGARKSILTARKHDDSLINNVPLSEGWQHDSR